MTVALLLSSHPLDLPGLEAALRGVAASIALAPIGSVSWDDAERAGAAELMRILGVEHSTCIVQSDAPTYDPGLFDEVTSARASIADALTAGLDPGGRSYFVLMYEWEGVESTRLLMGKPHELKAFLKVSGGWPTLRLGFGRGGYAKEVYPTLVFEIALGGPYVSEPAFAGI